MLNNICSQIYLVLLPDKVIYNSWHQTFHSCVTLCTLDGWTHPRNLDGRFFSSFFLSPPIKEVQSGLLSLMFFQTLNPTPLECMAEITLFRCLCWCWILGIPKLSSCYNKIKWYIINTWITHVLDNNYNKKLMVGLLKKHVCPLK